LKIGQHLPKLLAIKYGVVFYETRCTYKYHTTKTARIKEGDITLYHMAIMSQIFPTPSILGIGAWGQKIRFLGLPDGERILTNEGQTPADSKDRAY